MPPHDHTTPEQLHARINTLETALTLARHELAQARALVITADDHLRRAYTPWPRLDDAPGTA